MSDLNAPVEVECPGCHHRFKLALGKLRPGKSTICPACKKTIEVTGDDVPRMVDDLIAKARKTFRAGR